MLYQRTFLVDALCDEFVCLLTGVRSRKAFGKNQITIRAEVHAEESAYDGRHLPPNHSVYF
jgi:hypothetical protein